MVAWQAGINGHDRAYWDKRVAEIEDEAIATFVWERLESTPGFNEEMAQALADVKAGRVTSWQDVKRRLDEEGYEPPAVEGTSVSESP